MKRTTFFIILFLSICMIIFGMIKDKKNVKEMGFAGIVFLIIASISDFIVSLDF